MCEFGTISSGTKYKQINKMFLQPYSCSYCRSQSFADFDRFKHHINRHKHFKRSYYYSKLQHSSYSGFSRQASVLKNFSKTGEKQPRMKQKHQQYQCDYCEKRFWLSSHKTSHERNEKPCVWSYCDKCFSHESNKKIHERTHTKEKPYQCGYCEKRFSNSSHKIDMKGHTLKRSRISVVIVTIFSQR